MPCAVALTSDTVPRIVVATQIGSSRPLFILFSHNVEIQGSLARLLAEQFRILHTGDMTNTPQFPGPDPYAPLKNLPTFELTSPDIVDGALIDEQFRAPSSISPELNWSDLPEGTKSIAVTCFDPDAPTAAGFWHWAVFNIPADATGLPQNAGAEGDENLPAGAIQLVGDSGLRGHYGANPPAGHAPHRYMYAVHAVDVDKLDVPADATPTVLGFNLYFHSIARAIITPWWENRS